MNNIKYYNKFNESNNNNINYKNLISELCIAMILLNNEFLDNILDRGLIARYNDNSHVFVTDLKNLLLAKNRLCLGKYVDNKCVEDTDLGPIASIFDNNTFDMKKDWNKLVDARVIARNIIDKILPNSKLLPDDITNVYWLGINKNDEHDEDIVIETSDGNQYPIHLNKSLATQKSASFNLLMEDMIGNNVEKLFNPEYLPKWDKLVNEWIKLIYFNSKKNIQGLIDRFIDNNDIDNIKYFKYFNIKHKDPKYRYLGEYISEFDKNILDFSNLMSEIWKNKDICFDDPSEIEKKWIDIKIVYMNSKIIEHLITTSLKS